MSRSLKNVDKIGANLIQQVGWIDKVYDLCRVYEVAKDHMNDVGQINHHPKSNETVTVSEEATLWSKRLRTKPSWSIYVKYFAASLFVPKR